MVYHSDGKSNVMHVYTRPVPGTNKPAFVEERPTLNMTQHKNPNVVEQSIADETHSDPSNASIQKPESRNMQMLKQSALMSATMSAIEGNYDKMMFVENMAVGLVAMNFERQIAGNTAFKDMMMDLSPEHREMVFNAGVMLAYKYFRQGSLDQRGVLSVLGSSAIVKFVPL